jgi:hypothetical protein
MIQLTERQEKILKIMIGKIERKIDSDLRDLRCWNGYYDEDQMIEKAVDNVLRGETNE